MFHSNLPKPPYWAVIFVNQRTDCDDQGLGLTVCYWDSLDAIKAWRDHPEHVGARASGREKWYLNYDLHIARVERSYDFDSRS
ncbi:MAG: antibiotic biosynthesis monooxygenase [Magnetovibrio sp.]|nr:antibiotic biosynthesis monooxygenase [Magnetovibrio sp.]